MEVNSLRNTRMLDRRVNPPPARTQPWDRSPVEISINAEQEPHPEFIQRVVARRRAEGGSQLDRYFDEANRRLEPVFREFDRRMHYGTNRMIVAVIDSNSRELIREIPPEESLDLIEKMWRLSGLFVDQQF